MGVKQGGARGRAGSASTQVSAGTGAFKRSTILAASTFLLGLLVGKMPSLHDAPRVRAGDQPEAAVTKTVDAHSERANASTKPSHAIERPYLIRSVDSCVPKDERAEAEYRKQQSRGLIDLLRSNLHQASVLVPAEGGPEMLANQISTYQKGWLDSVVRTAPDLVDELAAEVERGMCSSETSDAEAIVLARTVHVMPELANPAAFDCIFAKHRNEDVVMWSALEAWKASGLPKSQLLTEIERSAKDDRTRARLADGPLEIEQLAGQRATRMREP